MPTSVPELNPSRSGHAVRSAAISYGAITNLFLQTHKRIHEMQQLPKQLPKRASTAATGENFRASLPPTWILCVESTTRTSIQERRPFNQVCTLTDGVLTAQSCAKVASTFAKTRKEQCQPSQRPPSKSLRILVNRQEGAGNRPLLLLLVISATELPLERIVSRLDHDQEMKRQRQPSMTLRIQLVVLLPTNVQLTSTSIWLSLHSNVRKSKSPRSAGTAKKTNFQS